MKRKEILGGKIASLTRICVEKSRRSHGTEID